MSNRMTIVPKIKLEKETTIATSEVDNTSNVQENPEKLAGINVGAAKAIERIGSLSKGNACGKFSGNCCDTSKQTSSPPKGQRLHIFKGSVVIRKCRY